MTQRSKLAHIRLAAFDVDGVLTNGGIQLDGERETKRFDVQDGLGLRLLMDHGVEVAWITARRSAAVELRARELHVTLLYQGEKDKLGRLREIAEKLGAPREEVFYMGDDFPDLKCIGWAGVGAAPANARQEVRERATLVTDAAGGAGAVREAAEQILIAKGLWAAIVEGFVG